MPRDKFFCEGPCKRTIYNNECVDECKDLTKFKIKDKNYTICLEACPKEHPYQEGDDTCTNACANGLFKIVNGVKRCDANCDFSSVKILGEYD